MKLQVKRRFLGETYTIGSLLIDYETGLGWQYFSDTLEDKVRDLPQQIWSNLSMVEEWTAAEIQWSSYNTVVIAGFSSTSAAEDCLNYTV